MNSNSAGQGLLTLIMLAFGILAGAVYVSAMGSLGTNWIIFGVGLLAAISVLLVVTYADIDIKYTIILLALFAIPIGWDINFLYTDIPPFIIMSNGIAFNIVDVLIFPLIFWWLILGPLLNGRHNYNYNWYPGWTTLMVLVLAINIISALTVPYKLFAFSALFTQIKAYLLFLYIANHVNTDDVLRKVGYVFAGMLFMQGVVALEQKFVGAVFTEEFLGQAISIKSQLGVEVVERISGTLGHPNALAMFLNLMIPTVVLFILVEPKWSRRLLMGFAVWMAVLAELFTASRGGWIGLGFALVAAFYLWQSKQGRNPLFNLGIIGLIGSILFGLLFVASSAFRNRLLAEDYGTAEIRYPLMEVAQNMIAANPFLGVGLNHYTHYMAAYDRTMEAIATVYPFAVHNTFLLIAGETGLPALFLFIGLLAITVFRGIRLFYLSAGYTALMSLGICCGLATWVLHNQVNLTSVYTDYLIWFLLAMIAGMEQRFIDQQSEAKTYESGELYPAVASR